MFANLFKRRRETRFHWTPAIDPKHPQLAAILTATGTNN